MYKESVFEDPEYIKLTTISSFEFFLSELKLDGSV